MKKSLLALLLVAVMLFGMVPMAALAENAAPSFEKVSMTLNSVLNVNFKVAANGNDMSGYSVKVTIGDDAASQTIQNYTTEGNLCVYSARLLAHRMHEPVKAVLMNGSSVVEEKTFLVADYATELKESSDYVRLHSLLDSMENYGTYAAAYANAEIVSNETVDAVEKSQLAAYRMSTKTVNGPMGVVTSLYLDDACDLRIKFNATAFEGCTLYIDGTAIDSSVFTEENTKLVYSIPEILPQNWSKLYNIRINKGEQTLVDIDFGVLSYAYAQIGRETEIQTGLNGMLKAMYLYCMAAKDYEAAPDAPVELPDQLLNPENWSGGGTAGNGTLTVPANSQLKADYLKALWNEGYTHLVFTVNAEAASDNNTNYTHGGSWDRYWRGITPNGNQDIRIDLNEFHDGDTWYSINFNAGNMAVSAPKAYKSAETLAWTKIGAGTPSNVYFAIEDGYYVLETITAQGVTSPTEWLAKYCVTDDASQRTWRAYTDYITQGSNTRSLLWGWGSAVNTLIGTAEGGWTWLNGMQTDGYESGEVFSLHTDLAGTARFKMLDWVSNRNEWNAPQKLEYVDDQTIIWSAADSYKLRLATTQDIIASGATGLKVTLTGDLGSALIWYGEDDWGDGENSIDANSFVNGSYTFQVDLTTFKATENFTMMANAASFTDLQVKVEPVYPIVYKVTAPEGHGYTFSGNDTVGEGESYTFTVTPNEGYSVKVKVNGAVVIGSGNTYTVENVNSDLVITVSAKEVNVLDELLLSSNWNAAGTETEMALTLPANSQLNAAYLQKLWNAGYTHLVFTANLDSAGAFINGGSEWDRYWREIPANANTDIRVDLNEFNDNGTWSSLNFINMASGNITVSNPRAYKSAETLQWTKIGAGKPSNVYFALENGYYVLETISAQGVTSPTEWLAKYCVTDDASQRSWRAYTDYITQGGNTRSLLWGWGSAVNTLAGTAEGGWSWLNGMQTDGYTAGEVFSLHTDVAGTARFKMLDWVSNRNEWNAPQKLEYVDDQTIRWSGADSYKLRLATTQDLIAAGYTHLNVTLIGDLGSALIWYGEDDWNDGENSIDATGFVNGSYTFEVDLTTFKATENFTLMGNAAAFSDILVKVEPIQKEIPVITYTVTAPTGNDFIFSGAGSVVSGNDYSFTVEPFEASTTLTVYVNGTAVTPVSGCSYLVKNVSENLTITVEAKLFAAADVILNTASWSNATALNADGSLSVGANTQLTSNALKALWDQGYTHLVFTVNAETAANYTHSGNWERYWRSLTGGTPQVIRIDLNEFHDGDTWYSINFSAGEMTVSDVKAYKSAETLTWTKIGAGTPSNVYFAIEDGYYVLETITAQGVTSPTQWLAKYCVTDDASQRSFRVYTDYIAQGGNTRSLLWGWGQAVNTVIGTADGGWTWLNGVQTDGYTDGEVFSLHTDVAGTARFKILDWVSNRNEWNAPQKLEYVDEQTIIWSAADSYKLRLATTQDLIAAGATGLRVTLTGDLGSAMIWYGEDDWNDGEIGIGADKFTNGSYTFEVDLTTFKATESFTMMANAASFTDMQVKIEPIGFAQQYRVKLVSGSGYSLDGAEYAVAGQDYSFKLPTEANVTLGTVTVNGIAYEAVGGVYTVPAADVTGNLIIRVESITVSNAIVAADSSYTETAKLLEKELEAVSGNYGVYTLAENTNYTNSILLGTETSNEASVAAERYTVKGNGTNIYVDGNCKRAVSYGAADLLRSLGYEFYTADVTTRPASVSLNFSMTELTDTADFAIRSYLSNATSYNGNSLTDQTFTVLSKNNNALVADYGSFGGGVELESLGGGVHNFSIFFADHAEGKYGYTVNTGAGSDTGFAPCLTNGISYNQGGADTTLTYAVARMKEAILANPDTYYFSFCQDDGTEWYCKCDHCTADAATYNRSGILVNFVNAMIAALEADSQLSGRDFKILTFAYGYTAQAPQNISALSSKLYVWYAQWHNANYSINSDSQDLNSYKENLRTWADLTANDNLGLWLYDTSFENYLSYFPSVNTIAQNITDAKALGISNILVQGAWNAEFSWQADMKSYIWSKLLWDSSLNVDTLQSDFLKAYFGDAAYSSAQTFVNLYDDNVGSSATVSKGYPISSGYGFYCHKDVYKQSTVHSKAIDAANAAIAAINADSSLSAEQKALYIKRANALLATVYGSVIGNWNGYENWRDAFLGSDTFGDFEAYFGASVADCQAKLTAALDAAGITVASESYGNISDWLSFITNRYKTSG